MPKLIIKPLDSLTRLGRNSGVCRRGRGVCGRRDTPGEMVIKVLAKIQSVQWARYVTARLVPSHYGYLIEAIRQVGSENRERRRSQYRRNRIWLVVSDLYREPPDQIQESPHEHQQSLLLSRIITNVVRACEIKGGTI